MSVQAVAANRPVVRAMNNAVLTSSSDLGDGKEMMYKLVQSSPAKSFYANSIR